MAGSTTPRPLFRLSRSYAAQPDDDKWLTRGNLIWVLIALAVGFFARVNELGAQSLWNDEGTSVALARTSISAIVNAAARDIHPPLYYILLSGWIQFAGISEFAIRFLSVFAGVLVIAVTFRIAREFFDQEVAVIAALLSALNPFQVYYAQETRMYIWVTLFAALSVWAMVVMFKPPRSQRIRARSIAVACYVIFTLAALYTNYYAFTLIVFENLAFIVWLIWARHAKLSRVGGAIALWFAVQVIVALAYLPWLLFARQSLTSWPGISEPMSFFEMTWRVSSAFVAAADSLRDFQALLVGVYILFFIGGLFPSRDLLRQSVWGIVTCALWAIVPLTAMFIVSLTRPAYNPKFLLLATPGFLILVARGISVLYPGLFLRDRAPYGTPQASVQNRLARQWIGIGKLFVGALLFGGTLLALQNVYTDPRLQRDDYRGIVNYINGTATDKDAVVVNAPGQMDVVRYYYHGAAALKPLPIGRPADVAATEQALDEILDDYQRAYGIFWADEQSDPNALVEGALNLDGFKARDEWHGNVRLVEYSLPNAFQAREIVKPNVRFGDEILLEGYTIGARQFQSGTIVPLWLGWQTLKTPSADWQIFIHLLDARGEIVSQRDAPLDNEGGMNGLAANVGTESRHGVVIPPGTPPGEYILRMGLYHPATGARLPVSSGGDSFLLGTIQVLKTNLSADAILLTRRVNAAFDTISLLGYTLARAEYQHGEFIPFVIYWQAREKPMNDLEAQVQLHDPSNNVVASVRAFENYPTSRWDKDEIVRDVLRLNIPQDALLGEYRIVVTDGARSVDAARVQVK